MSRLLSIQEKLEIIDEIDTIFATGKGIPTSGDDEIFKKLRALKTDLIERFGHTNTFESLDLEKEAERQKYIGLIRKHFPDENIDERIITYETAMQLFNRLSYEHSNS